MYVKPDLKTVIAQRTIPFEVARVAVDFLLKAGLDVWVYQGNDWFIRDPQAPRVDRERGNVQFDPTVVVDELESVLETPVKIVGVSMDYDLVARCEAGLAARLGADASAVRSQPYYLDVTHPEANKGMVTREAARILRIPLDDVATIGDMLNDVPMLRIAGMGIAMGNANDEVQRTARHVTRSNTQEGFAYAMDNFVLGQPPRSRTPLGLPPRARACLFGLEGVLTQPADLHAKAWKRLFDPYLQKRAAEAGEPFVPFDIVHDYARYFDGKEPVDDVHGFIVSRGIELPEVTLRALCERKGQLLTELLKAEHVEAYEGTVRYARAARAAGLRTAVVSLTNHCEAMLESAGIAQLFDVVTTDGVRAALVALDVQAEEAVLFEDEPAVVDAGREAHVGYIVGVDRGGRGEELRKHGADTVVGDLGELLMPEMPGAIAA
jgi:hydroxymethylpyrimidine pyrophosphatase-like HAD family hydrolase/beta-phosphoglucomutase-like phosphatase (HAD superfamily)